MLCKNHSGCLMTAGKLPEFVAKWITAHGITPGVLTLHQQDDGGGDSLPGKTAPHEADSDVSVKSEHTENPIVCESLYGGLFE